MIDLRPHLRRRHRPRRPGTGEPRSLGEALIDQRNVLSPRRVFVGASYTGLLRPEHADVLRFAGFGATGRTSALARAGVLDILPVHSTRCPR